MTMTCGGIRRKKIFVFVSISLVMAASSWGYVSMRWGSSVGLRIVYANGRFPLRYYVEQKTASGTPNMTAGSTPMASLKAALATWQNIPTASISFAELQTTSLDSTNPDDGLNLITMSDTPINRQILGISGYDYGPVAMTRVVFNKTTGEITDSDIILNPLYQFSTTLAPDTYDLQAIVTHELGHALGCDHAVAQSDAMFFMTGLQEFYQRYLSVNEMAFASSTYPNGAAGQFLNSLYGRVTQRGVGVFGASVTALNSDHNLIYSTITDKDGGYMLTGPISGRYVVYVEPLDGPARPDQLLGNGAPDVGGTGTDDGYYDSLSTDFVTTFAGSTSVDDLPGLEFHDGANGKGETQLLNISLRSDTSTLNIDRMGRGDADGSNQYLAVGPVVVHPGEDPFLLTIGGNNTWNVAGVADIKILGEGISLDAFRGVKTIRSYITGYPVGISLLITVAPDAVPGPRTVLLKVGSQQVASTGGIVVSQRSLPSRNLYFPYLRIASDQYTGVALANTSTLPAGVRLTARDKLGTLIYEKNSIVPNGLSIPAHAQTAKLGREIFNLAGIKEQDGWMTVESDSSALQGFFLAGDLQGTYLDGAEAFTRPYKQLYFVDVLQNSFTTTEIHLINVKDAPVTVQLTLSGYGPTGPILRGPVLRSIPPGGKIGESLPSIFGSVPDLLAAHVIASAKDEALVGFQIVHQENALFGLNAQPAEAAASTLYSPQLAAGNFGVNFRTRLNVLNVGDSPAQVSVALYSDNGSPLPGVSPSTKVTLPAGGHWTIDAQDFFSLSPDNPTTGSIKVLGGSGSKLLGNVVFGDGDPTRTKLVFDAALPLSSAGATSFLFSQVAQGKGFYTGVAFMAPDSTPPVGARVLVEAFAQDGTSVGSTSLNLTPRTRVVRLLKDLIPDTDGQVGGYVKVSAASPVIAFELFGSDTGEFLSAVPPQKLVE